MNATSRVLYVWNVETKTRLKAIGIEWCIAPAALTNHHANKRDRCTRHSILTNQWERLFFNDLRGVISESL